MNALQPLLAALDAAPHTFFIRDDDAGWDDQRLFALLDVTGHAGVPIDLAAIPVACHEQLAAALRPRIADGLVAVHQHGCTHANHEPEGTRKCEFGAAREAAAQRRDLAAGRARLQSLFGDALSPWFTPPWNRLAPHTPALLAEAGYALLSRDAGAPPQTALPELPVAVDWTRHHREGGPAALAAAWAGALRPGRPCGLMLHHAVMDEAERDLLAGWLRTLAAHPHARWVAMGEAAAC